MATKKNTKKQVKGAKKEKKSANKKLEEKLFTKKESGWLDADTKKIFSFSEDYKKFLKTCKTEREVVNFAESLLKKHGFRNVDSFSRLKKGDKVYLINRNKNVAAAIIGSDSLHIVGAHIDSPRLDLKPYPIFEDSNLALLKSHYYGGIKKYQWVNRPLAFHGIVTLKGGSVKHIRIGSDEKDPVFVIPDLLPHLAQQQMKREANKIITGEELNIVVGNIPVNDKDITDKVKFILLKYLYDKFGVTEEDLIASEIEIVPAESPRDVGFDRSMIAAYGHDDRVCAYTGLKALLDAKPKSTAVLLLFDKEEIGSEGDTGAKSSFTDLFVEKIAEKSGLKLSLNEIFYKSKVLSADVTAGLNPIFKDVQDPANSSLLSNGVSVEKYGGGGGKFYTNDASAEYMRYIIDLFNKNKVKWQTGELGKIDVGGGGTIAMFLAKKGCEVVDVGPAVLGMHSPFELVSKFDVYQSYLAYKVFLSD